VRDIAYHKIKQGLIYRGPSFETFDDDSQKVITNITNKGKNTIKSQLKIKTEVDLRKNVTSSDPVPENCNITKSAIDGVTLKALPMYYGGQNILTYVGNGYDNPARIKDFFYILGEKDNYPIYVHCSQGKDRTGCLAYLLQALLGEDEDTRYRDYLFSNLANTTYNMKATGISGTYGKTLSQYKTDGETFMEATYRYLNKAIGVSTSTLDAVINLLKA